MFYSQLYRSILTACRSLKPHTSSALIIGVPFMLSVSAAHASGVDVDNHTQMDVADLNMVESTDLSSSLSYSDITQSDALIQTETPIHTNAKADLADDNQYKVSFDNEAMQQSLSKLSQYYQLREEATNNVINETDTNTNDATTEVIDANQYAPVVAPKVFKSQPNKASYRCEGVWISPTDSGGDENYKQAIGNAIQQQGLSTENGLPLYAQADYAYYDSVNYVELSGNVEVVQNGQLITADQLQLDLDKGIAGASGNVLLANTALPTGPNDANNMVANNATNATDNATKNSAGSGLITIAEQLAFDTNSSAATAKNVAFASIPTQAHGYAGKLNRPDDSHVELDNVMFSTCPPTNRKWQLEAKQIDLDTDTGRGEAYNTTFLVNEVPVFYLPYFNFPIDDRRSTGLLTPSAGFDTEDGLSVEVPYYLNLAPNLDSTVTTKIYTNRNPMLNTETRYLTEDYGQGKLAMGYLPNDRQYDDEDRRGFFYQHNWASKSTPNLTTTAVYNYVSDSDYIDDFGSPDGFDAVDNRLNLPRSIRTNYYNEYLDAQLKVETFQSLKAKDADGNFVEDKDKPYSRLPQLSIDYTIPQSTDIKLSGTHDSAYFKKSINDGSENEKSGVRVYNEIGASYPMSKTWGYMVPELSLQHLYTAYDEESRLANQISRDNNSKSAFAPKFSLDSGLNFYQSGSPFGWFNHNLGGYQLLSPRLKYTYSKYVNQDDIPNFNTRIASLDYDQLFSDSWFLGYDRIADANNIALGLNYSYIDAMGVTRFNGSIGDQFYLNDRKVTLNADDSIYSDSTSGIAWNSSTQPYRNLWLDFSGALDSDQDLSYLSTQVRYQPTPMSLFNVGFIKRQEHAETNQKELSAITASTLIPINKNWRVMAQGQFDNLESRLIDSTLGVDYEDCCYGFSIYAQYYYNDLNLKDEPTKAIMAELRLNGLGESRSRLSKVISDKVLGFEPVDMLWK